MHALTQDPTVNGATVVALAVVGSPSAGFAIAADVRRFAGWDYYRVSTLRCVVPVGTAECRVAQGSSLSAEKIKGRAPDAIALAYLEAHLVRPPYLLAAHHAEILSSLMLRYARDFPALAAAALVDTAVLAHRLRGVPTAMPLESYAEQFQVPVSSLVGVTERAALTARLFAHLACQQHPAGVDLSAVLAPCAAGQRSVATRGAM